MSDLKEEKNDIPIEIEQEKEKKEKREKKVKKEIDNDSKEKKKKKKKHGEKKEKKRRSTKLEPVQVQDILSPSEFENKEPEKKISEKKETQNKKENPSDTPSNSKEITLNPKNILTTSELLVKSPELLKLTQLIEQVVQLEKQINPLKQDMKNQITHLKKLEEEEIPEMNWKAIRKEKKEREEIAKQAEDEKINFLNAFNNPTDFFKSLYKKASDNLFTSIDFLSILQITIHSVDLSPLFFEKKQAPDSSLKVVALGEVLESIEVKNSKFPIFEKLFKFAIPTKQKNLKLEIQSIDYSLTSLKVYAIFEVNLNELFKKFLEKKETVEDKKVKIKLENGASLEYSASILDMKQIYQNFWTKLAKAADSTSSGNHKYDKELNFEETNFLMSAIDGNLTRQNFLELSGGKNKILFDSFIKKCTDHCCGIVHEELLRVLPPDFKLRVFSSMLQPDFSSHFQDISVFEVLYWKKDNVHRHMNDVFLEAKEKILRISYGFAEYYVTNDPDIAQRFIGDPTQPDQEFNRFSTFSGIDVLDGIHIDQNLLGINGQKWWLARQKFNQVFDKTILNQIFEAVHSDVMKFLKVNLEKQAEEKLLFNIYPIFDKLTIQIFCSVFLGINSTETELLQKISVTLDTILKSAVDPLDNSLMRLNWRLPNGIVQKVNNAIQLFTQTCQKLICEFLDRKKEHLPPSSLLDRVVYSFSVELERERFQTNLSETPSIRGETLNMVVSSLFGWFLGGRTNLPNLLSWASFVLSTDHKIHEKLYKEIHKANITDYDSLEKLEYLDKFVKEVLRFYPPVSTVNSRVAQRDCIIDEKPIKRGEKVGINLFALHHNPHFWTKPEVFDPERFDKKQKLHRCQYLPFYEGIDDSHARSCLGKYISIMIAKISLFTLLQNVNFETATSGPVENLFFLTPTFVDVILSGRKKKTW